MGFLNGGFLMTLRPLRYKIKNVCIQKTGSPKNPDINSATVAPSLLGELGAMQELRSTIPGIQRQRCSSRQAWAILSSDPTIISPKDLRICLAAQPTSTVDETSLAKLWRTTPRSWLVSAEPTLEPTNSNKSRAEGLVPCLEKLGWLMTSSEY